MVEGLAVDGLIVRPRGTIREVHLQQANRHQHDWRVVAEACVAISLAVPDQVALAPRDTTDAPHIGRRWC